MKKVLLALQMILTLFVLAYVQSNGIKVLFLLPLWWVSFGGLSRKEWIAYGLINVLFIISDIGAIKNGFFQFGKPDVLGLPVWEFFMWGFYLLHTHRMFPPRVPKSLDLKLVMLAVVFSQVFAVIPDRTWLLGVTSAVLMITLYFYHEREDILYCAYLMLMGIAVETVGLRFDLWSYPETDYNSALVQFVIMWGAVGLYFRHIMGGWLVERTPDPILYRTPEGKIPRQIQQDIELAGSLYQRQQFHECDQMYRAIDAVAKERTILLGYEFYLSFSRNALALGHQRQAIELLREALKFAGTPFERAQAYMRLCQVYRMMILMKNARSELKKAFSELKLEMPRDSFFLMVGSIVKSAFQSKKKLEPIRDETERKTLQLQVALYEEAGLSAYYFREDRMLLQCSLKSKAIALRLGDSIEMVNWLGGSGCVWALIGWTSRARKMIEEAVAVSQRLNQSFATGKALLWKSLFLDYLGKPKDSAAEFQMLWQNPQFELTPHDRRLVATTLSCNYLMRGYMKKSEEIIQELTFTEDSNCRYFSSGKAYVDWYRLPAVSFLRGEGESAAILANSQIAFFRVDEERWQIAQFLGGLLMYYYRQKDKNLASIQACFERFSLLGIEPKNTYIEASFYWIAKAHLMIDLAFEGKIAINDAEAAVKELRKAQKHPSLKAQGLVAMAKVELLQPNVNFGKLDQRIEKASKLASQHDNLWVQFEILKFQAMKFRKQKSDTEVSKAESELRKFCQEQNWQGVTV
jgi:hypothetical protein